MCAERSNPTAVYITTTTTSQRSAGAPSQADLKIKNLLIKPAVGGMPAQLNRKIVREKLSKLSFQDPTKIADGLSYIWNEDQKWQRIALGLGMSDEDAKRKHLSRL